MLEQKSCFSHTTKQGLYWKFLYGFSNPFNLKIISTFIKIIPVSVTLLNISHTLFLNHRVQDQLPDTGVAVLYP